MQQLFDTLMTGLPGTTMGGGNLTDTLIALGIATLLTIIVAVVYMTDHRAGKYDQGFVQSLVLIGVIVTAVIKVVGYNVAGAFGLVGAVSIIRFRTRLSGPKDTAYMFLAIAIGLACGLQQYPVVVFATAMVCCILLLFSKTDFGRQPAGTLRRVLSVRVNDLASGKRQLERVFLSKTSRWELMNVTTLDDSRAILDYQVSLNNAMNAEEFFQTMMEQSQGRYSILRYDIARP
jgi:uncharacterized membrane protein YhiD involved in acid resistance